MLEDPFVSSFYQTKPQHHRSTNPKMTDFHQKWILIGYITDRLSHLQPLKVNFVNCDFCWDLFLDEIRYSEEERYFFVDQDDLEEIFKDFIKLHEYHKHQLWYGYVPSVECLIKHARHY